MNYPFNTILLYQSMMKLQKKGVFTENNLLAFLPHFWYNGGYEEYYDTVYQKKRKR